MKVSSATNTLEKKTLKQRQYVRSCWFEHDQNWLVSFVAVFFLTWCFEVVTVTVPIWVFSIVMILNIHDESLVLGVSLVLVQSSLGAKIRSAE